MNPSTRRIFDKICPDRAECSSFNAVRYLFRQELGSFPEDPEWQRTREEQIGYHASHLCTSILKDEIGNYERQMQALIRKVAASAAECRKA